MKITVRNICSWLIASLLIIFGVVRRARMKAMRGDYILSLYFHKPTKEEFEKSVRWLKHKGFTFLSPADVLDIIRENLELPKGAIIITVDDGWQSNESSIVEIANKYCVPVTIFVSTEPVEEGAYWWSYLNVAEGTPLVVPSKATLKRMHNNDRLSIINDIKKYRSIEREALTIEQVKQAACSPYVTIGGHTHSHPILINCEDEDVVEELKISKRKLETWMHKEVDFFAYPNGDYGQREMVVLRNLGYKLAFSSKPQYLTKESLKDYFELPRFGYLEGASFAENICRMVGIWQPLVQKLQGTYKLDTKIKVTPSSAPPIKVPKTLPQFN
ncbi:polysaccharide deacetylase family protein [uncultured Pontibacter sp.]|uniref:polysaccharide deacetylase family protein n=1 Tax=uncultured Pontibacter sp. TaxID=453356 RepID=UPI0026131310|nr:polysaccharide deacetylase family protein [uncultured Pontibacter sp.]